MPSTEIFGDFFPNGFFCHGDAIFQVIRHDPVDLEYAATVTPDLRAGSLFRLTLEGAATIANPSAGMVPGTEFMFQISQDDTGGHAVAWGNQYDFGDAPVPNFDADAANAVTIVRCVVVSATLIMCLATRNEGSVVEANDNGDTLGAYAKLHRITISAGADTATLPNGLYDGQTKYLRVVSDGGGTYALSGLFTTGGTNTVLATFDAVTDLLDVMWNGTRWEVLDNTTVVMS